MTSWTWGSCRGGSWLRKVQDVLERTETTLARQLRQAVAMSRFWAWHAWPGSSVQYLESITYPLIAATNQL